MDSLNDSKQLEMGRRKDCDGFELCVIDSVSDAVQRGVCSRSAYVIISRSLNLAQYFPSEFLDRRIEARKKKDNRQLHKVNTVPGRANARNPVQLFHFLDSFESFTSTSSLNRNPFERMAEEQNGSAGMATVPFSLKALTNIII